MTNLSTFVTNSGQICQLLSLISDKFVNFYHKFVNSSKSRSICHFFSELSPFYTQKSRVFEKKKGRGTFWVKKVLFFGQKKAKIVIFGVFFVRIERVLEEFFYPKMRVFEKKGGVALFLAKKVLFRGIFCQN